MGFVEYNGQEKTLYSNIYMSEGEIEVQINTYK